MSSIESVRVVNKYASEILDVVYNQDEFTTSDLQGVLEAIVRNIYEEGKKAH